MQDNPKPKPLEEYSAKELLLAAFVKLDSIKRAALRAAIAAYLRGD
jgi:hypothetical protein